MTSAMAKPEQESEEAMMSFYDAWDLAEKEHLEQATAAQCLNEKAPASQVEGLLNFYDAWDFAEHQMDVERLAAEKKPLDAAHGESPNTLAATNQAWSSVGATSNSVEPDHDNWRWDYVNWQWEWRGTDDGHDGTGSGYQADDEARRSSWSWSKRACERYYRNKYRSKRGKARRVKLEEIVCLLILLKMSCHSIDRGSWWLAGGLGFPGLTFMTIAGQVEAY